MSQSLNSPLAPTVTANQPNAVSQGTAQAIPRPLASAASAGPSTWQPPSHWNVDQTASPYQAKNTARLKSRLPEEQEIIAQTAARSFASFSLLYAYSSG